MNRPHIYAGTSDFDGDPSAASVIPPLQIERFGRDQRNILSGSWMPNTVHHNVRNDGDMVTWIPTGGIPGTGSDPAYVEMLDIRFTGDGLNVQGDNNSTATDRDWETM